MWGQIVFFYTVLDMMSRTNLIKKDTKCMNELVLYLIINALK